MVEVVIERWVNADGSTDHLWSLWQDGSRAQYGRKHDSSEAAETEALEYCHRTLGVQPDRVTRL
jgi:hypothetical protein